MTWRFMRHLLLVLGVYFLASSAQHWIEGLQRMTYETGDNASLGVYVIDEIPRAFAVIGAALLLWYTLGPAIARRWVWVLAGVFTLFRVIDVVGWRKAPSTRAHIAIALLMPLLASLIAAFLLPRLLPPPVPDDVTTTADTRPPRRFLFVALAATWSVVAFVFGVLLAVSFSTFTLLRSSSTIAVMLQSANRGMMADTQFQEGKYEEAKQTLLDFSAYLDGLKPMPIGERLEPCESTILDAKGLVFDKLLTYARLAVVEEQEQHADEAAKWWARAEEHARALNWSDPTREEIRKKLRGLVIKPAPRPSASAAPR